MEKPMKTFALIISLLVGTLASASQKQTYVGGGFWQPAEGQSLPYTLSYNTDWDGKVWTAKVSSKWTQDGEERTMSYEYKASRTDDKNHIVSIDGKEAGKGYCITEADKAMFCESSYTHMGFEVKVRELVCLKTGVFTRAGEMRKGDELHTFIETLLPKK